MKILFVLQELPSPATNGHRQKVLTILNYLCTRHDCDILCFGTPHDVELVRPWLESRPRIRLLGAFPHESKPFLGVRQAVAALLGDATRHALRYRSQRLAEAVENALTQRQYSVVHFDLISMAQYCLHAPNHKRILSLNDSLSLTFFGRARNKFAAVWFRARSAIQARLQMRIDRGLFDLAEAVTFVSPYDASWCRKQFGISNAIYIPLAVDQKAFSVVPRTDGRRRQTLVLVDKLWADQHRRPVEDFLRNHWGSVRTACPAAQLIVIGGRGIPSAFTKFANKLPGVELHEWVDDLEDTLAGTSIAVFPYAVEVGMKSRVLHCMASGNTVVGTPDSFRGLPIQDGLHAIIAKNHSEMKKKIIELLRHPELAIKIGIEARRFIQQGFTEELIGEEWSRLYRSVASGVAFASAYDATIETPRA